MRELTDKTTSIACELAALLMVVEEYRINWRQAWSSRTQRGY